MSEDDVNEPGIDPRRTTTTDYDSSAKQKEDGTYDISGTMNVPRLEEGDGAPEEELEKHIMEFDIYKNSLKNSGKHAYNTKLKDFKDLAAGKLGDIKDQLFPSWKKEDFAKIIKDLPGPFLLESNSQQETQLKEAVKSLIKKTLES
jgi:hypothetical protein